ncbi:MAG: hypothetical protein QME51_10320, partial [Planctomycetota bacterium]|nr:hypothetical protein [Planctomycetota bacterium]
ASTNHLRDFGRTPEALQGDIEKRARELVAKGQLSRRWITPEEKALWGYKEQVKVYEITPLGRMVYQMIDITPIMSRIKPDNSDLIAQLEAN